MNTNFVPDSVTNGMLTRDKRKSAAVSLSTLDKQPTSPSLA